MRIIGLMSGTSMDGVDAALVEVSRVRGGLRVDELGASHRSYPKALRRDLLAVASGDSVTALRLAELSARTASAFAVAARAVARGAGVAGTAVDLVASHGQTIAHRPGKPACSLQIGDAALIAERMGVTTVGDFRAADIAAGGEGAPLAPMAHYFLFADRRRTRAVQNLGGIGNVTWLPAGADPSAIRGSDTGPANILIDACMELISEGNRSFDRGGAMASRGSADEALVREVLRQPFFRRRVPASTGREEFGRPLARRLLSMARRRRLSDAALLASVTRATARSVARCYRRLSNVPPDEVWICGGGTKNRTLMRMLGEELGGSSLATTAELGVEPQHVEAVAFAVLGYLAVAGTPGNVCAATGARGPRVLGKIVPGGNYCRTQLGRGTTR